MVLISTRKMSQGREEPTPHAWAPTKSGSRLATSVDEPVASVNVSDGKESEVTASSSSSMPARPTRVTFNNKILIS